MKSIIPFLGGLFLVLISFFGATAQSSIEIGKAALSVVNPEIYYDARYYTIPYPNGDVDPEIGVCTDVVIRTYRLLGVDLQKEVHEDMFAHFEAYPKIWGLKSTDTNIDHRRVPNLMVFFERKGVSKPIKKDQSVYLPGDIVCWDLGGGSLHIGMVTSQKNTNGTGYLIVHNIGQGQRLEDCLFDNKIIGHYSYSHKKTPSE